MSISQTGCVKLGVVGWGNRGGLATIAHRPEEGVEVVALAEPNVERHDLFRQKIGDQAVCTTDFRELLGMGLDAVFLLSPDWVHEEQAVACLEAGVSVYLEKPMAITVEGCDRVLETAQNSGAKLYVGHNMRHFGVVRQIKAWIDEGLIGEVKTAWCRHFVSYGGDAYYRDWHADRSKTTGLLLQKGAHDIDVLHWLCGGYSKRVTAMGKLMVYGDIQDRQKPGEPVYAKFRGVWPPENLDSLNPVVDVEDVNMVLMEMDNGVLASYEHCMFSPDAWRNYTVIGSRGRIENFGDSPGSLVRCWNTYHWGYSETADVETRVPQVTGGHGGADEATVGEFLRFLREGGSTDTSPVAARMAVAAGVAATQSVRSGGMPVDVS
jgi:predicted dehydrogenase